MKELVLYTTHCPKCRILEKKLTDKGVGFTVCEDKDRMREIGIESVPVLELSDGTRLGYFDAVKHVNSL